MTEETKAWPTTMKIDVRLGCAYWIPLHFAQCEATKRATEEKYGQQKPDKQND